MAARVHRTKHKHSVFWLRGEDTPVQAWSYVQPRSREVYVQVALPYGASTLVKIVVPLKGKTP